MYNYVQNFEHCKPDTISLQSKNEKIIFRKEQLYFNYKMIDDVCIL